jgi:hypothetical protein
MVAVILAPRVASALAASAYPTPSLTAFRAEVDAQIDKRFDGEAAVRIAPSGCAK